jgi:hypothetical protein
MTKHLTNFSFEIVLSDKARLLIYGGFHYYRADVVL